MTRQIRTWHEREGAEGEPRCWDVRIIPGDARADVERVAVPDVCLLYTSRCV